MSPTNGTILASSTFGGGIERTFVTDAVSPSTGLHYVVGHTFLSTMTSGSTKALSKGQSDIFLVELDKDLKPLFP